MGRKHCSVLVLAENTKSAASAELPKSISMSIVVVPSRSEKSEAYVDLRVPDRCLPLICHFIWLISFQFVWTASIALAVWGQSKYLGLQSACRCPT